MRCESTVSCSNGHWENCDLLTAHYWGAVLLGLISSNSLEAFEQPVVHKYPAALAKQEFAFLFNADADALALAHFEGVGFSQWLIEEPDVVFDGLLVYADAELPQQLIESVLNLGSLYFADFETEFHKYCLPLAESLPRLLEERKRRDPATEPEAEVLRLALSVCDRFTVLLGNKTPGGNRFLQAPRCGF